jgi:hypothetical protein
MLKRLVLPLRSAATRLVDTSGETIVSKAATLLTAEQVEGDYLEFGVFAGSSFIRAHRDIERAFARYRYGTGAFAKDDVALIQQRWERMRFFAFDSFEGLPKLEGVDRQTNDFAGGQYACTEDSFRRNLAKAGVPLDKVVTVPGWFEDSCTEATRHRLDIQKAAIVHVDCDLYSSAKTVLDFVKPLLVDGTVLVFDDWYCFRGHPGRGEQRAFHEWKETMPGWVFTEYQKEGPARNSFIANRLDAA